LSIALLSSYVPRQCGIATFSCDLRNALSAAGARVSVIAMNDSHQGYTYPSEVEFEIRQSVLADYELAAEYVNVRGFDAVCIQHEFGLFGGEDGSYLIAFLEKLRAPIVSVLHTGLREPSAGQREVLARVARKSDRLVVMTQQNARLLRDVYGIEPHTVDVIPHGVPDMSFVDSAFYKDKLGLENKRTLLTFGLLSPNKGIEHGLRALAKVVHQHPDVVYVVLGATHPNLRRSHGEVYRLGLERLVRDLGISDHVIFHNRFVDREELCEYLGAADVFVTPYLNEAQVVSGALAYALGCGKAVISTPYWHAVEALADRRGRLVPFADPDALADAMLEFLGNDTERNATRMRAYHYSRDAVWNAVGRRYHETIESARQGRLEHPRTVPGSSVRVLDRLPEFDFAHLERLTDDTGMLQHAIYDIVDRAHGYCTDDNARALIAAVTARRHSPNHGLLARLSQIYLAFLRHAFGRETGAFRNLMSYERQWLEERGSEDSQGRALWALGVAAANGNESERRVAAELMRAALPLAETLVSPRAVAFALLGFNAYLDRFGGESAARRMRLSLADRLAALFAGASDPAWPWPEDVLTYANGCLPQALIAAGRALGRDELTQRGVGVLRWLIDTQSDRGRFVPIGNDGWYARGGRRARFDQQPIEADVMISACSEAFRATRDPRFLEQARRCFDWFLGKNDVGVALYDEVTGGCRDGLTPSGTNDNQGAESTLAWLHALVQMHELRAMGVLAPRLRSAPLFHVRLQAAD
jgi:glycosyltransferase involved in cell wall biosynthesis